MEMDALLLTSRQKARFFQQLDAVLHEHKEDAATSDQQSQQYICDLTAATSDEGERVEERCVAVQDPAREPLRPGATRDQQLSGEKAAKAVVVQVIDEEEGRGMHRELGGVAVGGHGSEQQRRRNRNAVASHSSPLVNWDDVKIVIASAQLDYEKVKRYYQCKVFPPSQDVKVHTPEWLMHLVREKKFPDQDTFEWSHAKQEIEQNMKHQRELEEAQAAAAQEPEDEGGESGSESVNDEGSDVHNSGNQEIKRVPPVHIDMDKIKREEEELQIQKDKLVKEQTPIFFQNNPGFKPIADDDDEKNLKTESFVCQKSSSVCVVESWYAPVQLKPFPAYPLEELMEYLHVERDIWREYMYKKVVSSLKAMHTRVRSARDLQGLWWAKGRLRERVVRLLETGKLEKLESKKANPRLKSLVEMSRIWGVGPATAAKLYNMGFKTLDELRKNGDSVLSDQQQIGLKHYDDFLKKIPRLLDVAALFLNWLVVFVRAPELLDRLHASGFITDDLTHVSEHHVGHCASYMGVCRVSKPRALAGSGSPASSTGHQNLPTRVLGLCDALFHGSDHFNRSMRLFARKKGWGLSDRGLKPVDCVNGKKVRKGETVVCTSEVDVFIALGLEYKDPRERNCFDIRFLDEDEANAKKKRGGDMDSKEVMETGADVDL
ncbi:DNA polymerase lambda-like protein, partial [Globisporangium splendens]